MKNGRKASPDKPAAAKLPWLPQLLCGFLFCFMLFIFAPVEMVQLNSADFWFTPGDFIGAFLLLFLAAFVAVEAVFALLRLAPRFVYHCVLALFFGVTLALYVQGNLLCQWNEVLSGGAPVWNTMLPKAVVNLAIWCALLLAALFVMLRSPKALLKVVSFASALLLLMTGGSLIVSLSVVNQYDSDTDYRFYYTSREDVFTVSGNGDVIVFMLDNLDARVFERAMKENPEVLSEYDGFTFYRNTAGTYNKTDPSVVAMLTGALCRNEEPFYPFSHRAFAESRFFPELLENGYTINLYGTPSGLLAKDTQPQVANLRVERGEIRNWPQFIKPMLRMVGYRYAPVFFQPILYDAYVDRFDTVRANPKGAPAVFSKSNGGDIKSLKQSGLTVDDTRKFFKYYCYIGAHAPYTLNRHGELNRSAPFDMYDQSLGYLNHVNNYLRLMKESGVYDQSTVVLLADHGDMDMGDTSLSTPTLLVKYPNQTGELRVSNAPTSLLDLRATVMYGVGADFAPYGKPVHLWAEGESRERRYYLYTWLVPRFDNSFYLKDLVEYAVPDDASAYGAYQATGDIY